MKGRAQLRTALRHFPLFFLALIVRLTHSVRCRSLSGCALALRTHTYRRRGGEFFHTHTCAFAYMYTSYPVVWRQVRANGQIGRARLCSTSNDKVFLCTLHCEIAVLVFFLLRRRARFFHNRTMFLAVCVWRTERGSTDRVCARGRRSSIRMCYIAVIDVFSPDDI